jgi:hypothetical protein
MPEFGSQKYQQKKSELQDKFEDKIQWRVSSAYEALAEGKMSLASGHAVFLIEMLDLGVGPYNSDEIPEGEFEDYAAFESFHRSVRWYIREVADVEGVIENPASILWDIDGRVEWSVWEDFWNSVVEKYAGQSDLERKYRQVQRLMAEAPVSPEKEIVRAVKTMESVAAGKGYVPEQVDPTYVIGEDFEESPLHEMYEKRRSQGRALQGIIVARDNDTGTGKTTLAVQLCKKWGEDWGAENATNRAREYRDFLNNKPEGSVLLADEIGQMFDSRRSMSSENVAVSQDWQMIRTKQYITLSTLPGPSFLDKRLKKLADVIMLCTRRGHARVYRLKVDDGSGDLWREHLCNVEWGALDDDEDYQQIEEMKRSRLTERFDGGDQDDVEQLDEDSVRREGRNETIRQLVDGGMTQTEVADALNMDQSMVSRIVRADSGGAASAVGDD